MDAYLEILKEKAKKVSVDIEDCAYDKECIKDSIALQIRTNLEKEDIRIIKQKAIEIKADFLKDNTDKNSLLKAIEKRVKEVLEEENEKFTSMQLQQNFMPLDLC